MGETKNKNNMRTINKKVLIIDDDEATSAALETKFGIDGFTVLLANNGEKGLIIAQELKPDIILLDIIMPKMDGLTFLKKLREDGWGKNVPVIILTNLSDDEKISEAVTAGTYEYLIKSDWWLEDVVKKVKNKLGLTE